MGDFVGLVDDVDGVDGLVVAGVADPLGAGHPLVFGIHPEAVDHPAVESGDTRAGADGGVEALPLLVTDLAHGPEGYDQVGFRQQIGVEITVEGVADGNLHTVGAEDGGEKLGGFLGCVAIPAALDDQYLLGHDWLLD